MFIYYTKVPTTNDGSMKKILFLQLINESEAKWLIYEDNSIIKEARQSRLDEIAVLFHGEPSYTPVECSRLADVRALFRQVAEGRDTMAKLGQFQRHE